jgi:hypothetical protein
MMQNNAEQMLAAAIDADAAQVVVVAEMKMRTSRGTLAPGAEPDSVEEKPRRKQPSGNLPRVSRRVYEAEKDAE